MRLANKVAIVTGSTFGIGKETAILFAQEGAKVVVSGRTEDAGQRVAQEINAFGGEASFVQADVSKADDVRNLVEETVQIYGKLDVLFNNAGMGNQSKVADESEEMWDKVIDVNLKGVFLGIKYAVPEMINNGGGSIINNSSMWGIAASHRCSGAYAASKAGVAMLSKQAALHYAQNMIRINSILAGDIVMVGPDVNEEYFRDPAVIATLEAVQPLPKMATPRDVAYGVLYLASDESAFVTGTSLVIDGGMTIAEVLAGRLT